MNATKNLMLANALAGILLVGGLGTPEAAETSPVLKTMKPMAGISFDIGTQARRQLLFERQGNLQA